jgi:hypothetical protein
LVHAGKTENKAESVTAGQAAMAHVEHPRTFETKPTVEVNSIEPFVLAQLQRFLRRRCYVYLGYDGAESPLDDTAFALIADWIAL